LRQGSGRRRACPSTSPGRCWCPPARGRSGRSFMGSAHLRRCCPSMRASSAWKPSSLQRRSTSGRCEGARAITAPPPPRARQLGPRSPPPRARHAPAAPAPASTAASRPGCRGPGRTAARAPSMSPTASASSPARLSSPSSSINRRAEGSRRHRCPTASTRSPVSPRLPRKAQAQLHRLAHGSPAASPRPSRTRRCRHGERRPRPRPMACRGTPLAGGHRRLLVGLARPCAQPTARATATAIAAELPRPARRGISVSRSTSSAPRRAQPADQAPSALPHGEPSPSDCPAASPAPTRPGPGARARAPRAAGPAAIAGWPYTTRARPAG
jgi:hypothetical protein